MVTNSGSSSVIWWGVPDSHQMNHAQPLRDAETTICSPWYILSKSVRRGWEWGNVSRICLLEGVPWWHSGLRTQCCPCRGPVHCGGAGSISGPGISACGRHSQKEKSGGAPAEFPGLLCVILQTQSSFQHVCTWGPLVGTAQHIREVLKGDWDCHR